MMSSTQTPGKSLGIFAITMINVIAIDSLKTLPISAEYGLSLVFYYALAALLFFIPIALISAELATGWPAKGGAYVWVREAFGEHWAFLAIWMQWMYNLIWFPTILVFIVDSGLAVFFPQWLNHKPLILSSVLVLFWGATWLNFYGMKLASSFSTVAAVLGTLLPMAFIIVLGTLWLIDGNTSPAHLSWDALFPQASQAQNIVYFTFILFGLMGIEMSAVHADEVKQPGHAYPRAIALSAFIILTSLVLASLAIVISVPKDEINVIHGLIQSFSHLLHHYQLDNLLPIVGLAIVLSGLGNVSAWIIGPTKSILVAAQDGTLPKSWATVNEKGAPTVVLLVQAIIFTLLCGLYVLMPSLEEGYILLTAMTAQMALGYYALVFCAGMALKKRNPNHPRAFSLSSNTMAIIGSLGLMTCIVAIIVGFFPPELVSSSPLKYDALLILGVVLLLMPPLWVFLSKHQTK